MNHIVEEILVTFGKGLEESLRTGIITSEHLETTNRNKLNKTHSLVLGALCHSLCQTLERKHAVALGHSLKSKGMKRRFTPDISLWKAEGVKKLIGVLDYESTNSSDSRIMRRDFENYHQYIHTSLLSNIPEFWVIITTLPSKKVSASDWYSWDLRRKRMSRDEYMKMLENPFGYWFLRYSDEFSKLGEQLEKCPLHIVNLNATELRLCLPKDEAFSIRILP